MQLLKRKIPQEQRLNNETSCSRHIPFTHLADDHIVMTKNGDFLTVLKITGIAFDTVTDQILNEETQLKAKLFNTLLDSRFAVYHSVVRSKLQIDNKAHYDIKVADDLYQAYQTALQQNDFFNNEIYLTLLLKGAGNQGNCVTARINQLAAGLSYEVYKKKLLAQRTEAKKALSEAVTRISSALAQYGVKQLKTIRTNKGHFSETLQVFSRFLNWDTAPLLAINSEIASYLAKKRIFFGHKSIELHGNTENDKHYAAMISLKEYGDATYPGMLNDLLKLPIEMLVTQSMAFQTRQQSRETLELKLRRLIAAKDPDNKGQRQLSDAIGDLVAGQYGFGRHHLSIMVIAKNFNQLEKAIALLQKQCDDCGIVSVRERLNMEAAFWAQLPGNFRYIARKMPITTNNFSCFCCLHKDSKGQAHNNYWGDAVTVLKTPANLPYFFNFHKPNSDLGHSLVIGRSGSGKTLAVSFLLAMTLKYNTKIFYFDKDHGAEIFMRSLGAKHITIGSGETTGFNPLQLPDTTYNRRFLYDFLKSLVTAFDDTPSGSDLATINDAVRHNYEVLAPAERHLKNIAMSFGLPGENSLRDRIDQWHSHGRYAEFFGAEQDSFDLTGKFFCFEMNALLDKANDIARPSVLLYLFHRIDIALREHHSPTIICLDEAWKLLGNELFANSIQDWLKTFRKRNAIVILMAQELNDIVGSAVSASIAANTVTKIFFPDPTPQKQIYQEIFHLNEREINLLAQYKVEDRFFLIKQEQESALVKLDLSAMLEWIPLLSGNADSIKRLKTIMAAHGEAPEQWLPIFMEETAHV